MPKPLRLLQIEDSESDAEMIARLLTQAGFEVFSQRVEDAEGLRHALDTIVWDVVVADYHLPGFDAPAALRILQDCGKDIPCIVVSGKLGEDTAVAMMKSGAHDYLTKEHLSRLAPAVEREVAEAEVRRDGRRAQAELRESQERLTLAVEATQIGTFDFYPQTGKLIWSSFAREHFGASPGRDVTYDTFLSALHSADRERAAQKLQAALQYENGGDYTDDYRTVGLDDGQERWLSSRGRIFFDAQFQAVRMVGIVQNVTERKRLETQLLQSQKLEGVGRLAESIAHDFNNLLMVINGHAQLVMADLRPGDPLRDPMEELSRAALQAAGLTRQLLSFSRRQVAEPKTVVMNEFVKEYESMLRRLLGEDIELVLLLSEEAGAFLADPGQMSQVLMNLTVNSRDAMPTGGKIVIETSNLVVDDHNRQSHVDIRPGRYAVLSFTDTGTGMSAEAKSNLFDPFFSTKEPGKSTGLGLSTVYGIVVNQCGGSIRVESEPGHGAAFKLFFPSIAAATVTGARVDPEPTSSRGETILVAEDEEGVRKYAREILQRHGYTVLEAGNGEEALSLAKDHAGPVDLLLTDIIMPMMGGVELSKKFNAEYPGVPVLFMSGHSDQIMRHWDDFRAYIQKPFTISSLLTQVREILHPTDPNSLQAEDRPAAG